MNQTLIVNLIRNLGQRVQELLGHELEFLGLGPGQLAILTQIIASPGISQGRISRQLKLDKSTVSRAVRILIYAGYVEKRSCINDQKSHSLRATKLSLAFTEQMNSIVEETESVIIDSLNNEEVDQFQKYLKKASDNLERHLNHRRALLATEAHPLIERT